MKTNFLLLCLLLLSFMAYAQQTSLSDSSAKRAFIGASISSAGYQVMGKPKYDFIGGVTPFLSVYYGYKVSKRATIQAGIGYGGNEIKGGSMSRFISPDSVYDKESYQRIRALVFPVTFKFTPFNPGKRLQLYANASITPVLGHIKARATESYKGEITTVLYDEETTSLTLITTAGLTLNYRINQRLDGYVDGLLFYKNLNFQRPDRYYKPKSIGLGVNYKL